MPDLKALQEERLTTYKRLRELADKANDEKRDFTGEEEKNWEDVNGAYNRLSKQVTRETELAAMAPADPKDQPNPNDLYGKGADRLGALRQGGSDHIPEGVGDPGGTQVHDDRNPYALQRLSKLAFAGWALHQMGKPLDAKHVEAAKRLGLSLEARELCIKLMDTEDLFDFRATRKFAQGTTQGDKGAFLIAPLFMRRIEEALLAFGGMRQVAETIRTDTGAELPIPTMDDTSNTGARIAEGATVTQQDVALKQIRLQAYKYTSKEVVVSFELLQDSAFDLPSMLARVMGTRIARVNNQDFTTGTGADEPKGIVTAATLGKTAASATSITADEILDLIHSVDPAYRDAGFSPTFMMHDNTLLHLRKKKTGTGDYLFEQNNAAAMDRIKGFPIVINQAMASSVATTNKTVLFGALGKYMIRDIGSIRLRRLVERRALEDQESFIAFTRSDGNLIDAGTNPVKYLQQA